MSTVLGQAFRFPTEDLGSSGVVGCLLAELQQAQDQLPQNSATVFHWHAEGRP